MMNLMCFKGNVKRVWATLGIVVMMVGVTACGANKKSAESYDKMAMDNSVQETRKYGAAEVEAPMEMKRESLADTEMTTDGGTNPLKGSHMPAGRKIIQNVSVDMETLEFDETIKSLNSLVGSYGGYIESSNVSGKRLDGNGQRQGTRFANYTIRIPNDRLVTFLDEVMVIGNVYSSSAGQEDVTMEYVDTEARIKTLEVQEERLLELLQKGEDLEQLIILERQLSDIRYQIESNKSRIMALDNLVSYGSVYLSVQEVYEIRTVEPKPALTFGQKIARGFTNSIKDIKQGAMSFVIVFVAALPHLVIFAIEVFVVVMIVKAVLRKIKKRKGDKKGDEGEE